MEPRLLGDSPAMRRLRERIRRAGATEATVLIQGERGTGKELVADALVAASRRRARPYVKVNCAALPDELLASELFGHERGAFTGAVQRAPGLLAAADGGTVFLDEVGDLTPRGQAVLLRFLQEREVRPVGSAATARVDVRVIAATNRELEAAVARGEFRADLHDRLAEVVLAVPPLRERGEDIPRLAEHFLSRARKLHPRARVALSAEARTALESHLWPGNVRELKNAMELAVICAEGDEVRLDHLPSPVRRGRERPKVTDLRGALKETEKAALLEVLATTRWNVTEAAKRLGLPRRTVVYRMARLGLKRPRRVDSG